MRLAIVYLLVETGGTHEKDKHRDYVAMSLRYHTVKRNEHLAMRTSTVIKSKETYLEKSGEKPQRLVVLEKVTL